MCLATGAFATGDYFDLFTTHYKVSDSSALGKASCGACHVSDSDFAFNAYGKDLAKAMTDAGKTEIDASLLAALESLDSDGDGKSNGDEIKAGEEPGVGHVPAAAPAEKKKPPFPPKNGFHPAIVHFPIALFVGGLFLDFVGMLKKDKTWLFAGWLNLVMGAVTAVGGILSGVLAMTLMKLPYRGLIFDHLKFAVASSVIMFIMVAMRLHRHEKMNVPLRVVYYVLAAACFLMISWAGHLGGVFVYGE
jgi:uncharacterized membrane protein